jgi:(S)-2-hydroxyglutarate dehydrogenase
MLAAKHTDCLIIGAGVIGLAVARELKHRQPDSRIVIIEKEDHVAEHGSGRNSGVLHAGFYYSADSLKAKFCREGNALMKQYIAKHNLKIRHTRKLVVAKNAEEQAMLYELKHRGDLNGVETHIIGERQMALIDPNAATHEEALFSPTTATVNPVEICRSLAHELTNAGVEILLSHPYQERVDEMTVRAGDTLITTDHIINCAGLYADHIAKDFGFCHDYTIIPFKGLHLLYAKPDLPVSALIYPVPNLKNPFLGVHFNVTVEGKLKLGPTAIPAFWRENYQGWSRFRPDELAAIAAWELKLFAADAFHFRSMAIGELRKYSRKHLIALARPMVKELDESGFTAWARPGIRAQLLHKKRLELVQDFIVEGDASSVHVLNAVSPAFTSSMAFAKYVVEKYI